MEEDSDEVAFQMLNASSDSSDSSSHDEDDVPVATPRPQRRLRRISSSDEEGAEGHEQMDMETIVCAQGVAPCLQAPVSRLPVSLANYTLFGQVRNTALAWERFAYGSRESSLYWEFYK